MIITDVDGVLVDSVGECYARCCEAWKEIEDGPFPLNEEEFRQYRWSVVRAQHYFQTAMTVRDHGHVSDEELLKKRENYEVEEHKDKFYAARKKAMEVRENWISEHSSFEGVPEMIKELARMGLPLAAATSKDRASTKELLRHHELDLYFSTIYSKEDGDKATMFRKIKKDFGLGDGDFVVFYDDLARNLEVAEAAGFLAVAAPQGYDKPENIARFPAAKPLEFPKLVRRKLAEHTGE